MILSAVMMIIIIKPYSYPLFKSVCGVRESLNVLFLLGEGIEIQHGGQTLKWGKLSRGEIKSCHLYFPASILKSIYLQPVQSSLSLSITVLCMRLLILPLELIFLLLLLSFSHPIHSAISFFSAESLAFALYTLVVSTAQCSVLGSLIYEIQ